MNNPNSAGHCWMATMLGWNKLKMKMHRNFLSLLSSLHMTLLFCMCMGWSWEGVQWQWYLLPYSPRRSEKIKNERRLDGKVRCNFSEARMQFSMSTWFNAHKLVGSQTLMRADKTFRGGKHLFMLVRLACQFPWAKSRDLLPEYICCIFASCEMHFSVRVMMIFSDSIPHSILYNCDPFCCASSGEHNRMQCEHCVRY